MKKHAIIPIFIPHLGCPHSCVFCNQKAITARTADVSEADVRKTVEDYLSTLEGKGLDEIELSFFGGSFTGIPMERQSAFLKIAKEYKDCGRIDKIHLSTRPDYITKEILDNLKYWGADVIELGVQSFDQRVLDASEREHSTSQIYDACELIKAYGFTLGIQLMIGLPKDSYESCMYSAAETIKIAPAIARIYPTVVISDTKLAAMYESGEYTPFDSEETLRIAKDMYKALTNAGINVIRVGLKASSLINDGSDSKVLGGTYHPAFRQLLEGAIVRDEIEEKLAEIFRPYAGRREKLSGLSVLEDKAAEFTVSAGNKAFSNVIGHKGCNKEYFLKKYPNVKFVFLADGKLEDCAIKYDFRVN